MRAIGLNNNEINFKEPFKGLFTQGMVCHETYKDEKNNWLSPEDVFTENGKDYFQKIDKSKKVKVGPSESMSKSKKNTIDPQNMIDKYGADSVRFFILADSPPERDVQWSDEGMLSSYKFIQKLWVLSDKIFEISKFDSEKENEQIEIFTNKIIDKMNHALEIFRYNIVIAIFHEIYSFFRKIAETEKNYKNLIQSFKKILIIMSPVIPHFTSDCLEKLNYTSELKWPIVDKKYLNEDSNLVVIQVNGKKRNTILIKKDLDENKLIELIKEKQLIKKYLDNAELIKTIYIKNKIINFIIK